MWSLLMGQYCLQRLLFMIGNEVYLSLLEASPNLSSLPQPITTLVLLAKLSGVRASWMGWMLSESRCPQMLHEI